MAVQSRPQPEAQSAADPLVAHASAGLGRPAVIADQGAWSFAQLLSEAAHRAGRLAAAGLTVGDRLAVALSPGLEYVAFLHAATHLRVIWVPLHLRLTADETARALRDAKASFVIWDASTQSVAETAARKACVRGAGIETLRDGSPPNRPNTIPASALQGIVYTSGTTGRPKGAMITYRNHFSSARAFAAHVGLEPHDTHLACLPLYHVGGMAPLWRSVVLGQTVRILPKFDADQVNELIDGKDATVLSFVATTLARLLEARDGRPFPPSLKVALLGGGPVPRSLVERAAALGLPVAPTYGLTETASQIVTHRPANGLPEPAGAGTPLPGVTVRVAARRGDVGEIWLRGPMISPGYWHRPLATRKAHRHGWFHTGDIGRLNPFGELEVLARRTDLIVSGGENVYPAEIEAALETHPNVAEAAVIGVPDPHWGSAPAALVRLRPDRSLSCDELLRQVATSLAAYKRPRTVLFVHDELPRTASGKLRRNELPFLWQRQNVEGAPHAEH